MADPVDYNRLHQAVNASRLILRVPRQARLELVREAAGHRYGNSSADRPTKLNLLGVFQNIIAPLLIAKDPRYYVATFDQSARASVRIEQDWLNEQIVRIGLGQTGRTVVTDGLYSTGVMKVCLASPCDAAMEAWGITAGEPTASAIDFDDFVYDVAAKDFRYAAWIGHRYRCPLDVAKKMYGRAASGLVEAPDAQFNDEGDERIGRILRGSYSAEEFEPHVELWEIYLPRHGVVVTLSGQNVNEANKDGTARPLWVQKWVGPPTGPYHFLRFATVPGQALARAPMMDLYELHMDANNVHRKANNTLRRLKELTLYPRGQQEDAKEIQKAMDGSLVPVENPDKIKTVVTAGAAIQGLLTAAAVYKDLFSFSGGNLEVLGGRGPQSKTLGQEKIVGSNAAGGIAAMHDEVDGLMASAGEALLWYAHHHPQLVMQSEYKAPGSPGVNRYLHPSTSSNYPRRDFPFSRAKLRLDAYSIRHKQPEERLQFVQGVLQLFAPLMPMLQQQGVALDANELVDIFAELGDSPELGRIFTAAPAGGQGPAAGGSHERTMPSSTERTYNRTSSPQQAPGADQQAAEMSAQDFGVRTQVGGAAA